LWVQERNTDILYFSLKTSRQANPLQVPNGVPIQRDKLLQGIFTYVLIYLFNPKAVRKELPSMFPKSGARMDTMSNPEPYRMDTMSNPEPYLTYLLGSPVNKPYLQVPLMESPWREMLHF
jgi:hypothetical protein